MSTIEMYEPETDTLQLAAQATPRPIALPTAQTPAAIMALAIQQGAPVETIERMWALQVAYEEREAKKAYTSAMSLFKRNAPTITKDKHVSYPNSKGGKTEYDHATLGNVVKTITAGLAEQDISISWATTQLEGGRISVACTLTHKAGHSESVSLDAAKDDSGGKNSIQALGSAISYLQRYTLLAITGLATEDQDDDGAGSDGPGPITEKILDGLIADLKMTKTDAEASALWSSGSKVLAATESKEAYAEFKQHVLAHRNELREAGQ